MLLKEDKIKELLEEYLNKLGWTVKISWGNKSGIDVDAQKGDARWIIEVKGELASPQSQDKSYNDLLGAIIQRMEDPKAKYSIALPDIEKCKNLWKNRMPTLAKQRTGITALFVNRLGEVREEYKTEC